MGNVQIQSSMDDGRRVQVELKPVEFDGDDRRYWHYEAVSVIENVTLDEVPPREWGDGDELRWDEQAEREHGPAAGRTQPCEVF